MTIELDNEELFYFKTSKLSLKFMLQSTIFISNHFAYKFLNVTVKKLHIRRHQGLKCNFLVLFSN